TRRCDVRAIATDALPSLTARGAGLVRRPLVSGALRVRCPPTLAGDLSLAARVHGRETSLALSRSRHRASIQVGVTISSRLADPPTATIPEQTTSTPASPPPHP